MFHFRGDNLWLTAESLASIQFPKDTGFDEVEFFSLTKDFLNNLLVT